MIVFYKTIATAKSNNNIQRSVQVEGRVKITKRKITKNNKNFLRALGFKI